MPINRRKIKAKTQRIFDRHVATLSKEFRVTFNSEIFDWPRMTLRSTGEIAGSPRNIVDTGRLRDSQTLVTAPMYAKWIWSERYAHHVLMGTTKMPGRDWIKATFDRVYGG